MYGSLLTDQQPEVAGDRRSLMDVPGMGFDFEDLELLAGSSAVAAAGSEDEGDLRRGPWTVEEDVLLVNYVATHGEGRWNSLARSAGLKRTGKSCRLRWLNYLRPDVRRGNITASEQLLILELHSRWGNRWSKIAQHLPGRTDNEIKNYWRTRVQKHAKQLRCDVNSTQFRDVVRCVWMPRLLERIQAESSAGADGDVAAAVSRVPVAATTTVSAPAAYDMSCAYQQSVGVVPPSKAAHGEWGQTTAATSPDDTSSSAVRSSLSSTEASHAGANDNTSGTTPMSQGSAVQCGGASGPVGGDDVFGGSWSELLATATGRGDDTMVGLPDFGQFGEFEDNLWSLEDLCLQQQYCS